jgi:hypothetical protein
MAAVQFGDLHDHFLELLAHRAWNPPPSSSLAERKNASALSSSVRRRAITDARSFDVGFPPDMSLAGCNSR